MHDLRLLSNRGRNEHPYYYAFLPFSSHLTQFMNQLRSCHPSDVLGFSRISRLATRLEHSNGICVAIHQRTHVSIYSRWKADPNQR